LEVSEEYIRSNYSAGQPNEQQELIENETSSSSSHNDLDEGLFDQINHTVYSGKEHRHDKGQENLQNLKIIVAEDQLINMEVMIDLIEQLNLKESTNFCFNGNQTLDVSKYIL
jgi:hypothetical protein